MPWEIARQLCAQFMRNSRPPRPPLKLLWQPGHGGLGTQVQPTVAVDEHTGFAETVEIFNRSQTAIIHDL